MGDFGSDREEGVDAVEFAVSDVAEERSFRPECDGRAAIDDLLRRRFCVDLDDDDPQKRLDEAAAEFTPIEAHSHGERRLVADVHFHPFLAAVHLAFSEHRALVISPDMIWLLIIQGFALHVRFAEKFVGPRIFPSGGPRLIEIRRDAFLPGDPRNDWFRVFSDFSQEIREAVGSEFHDVISPRFSTTGAIERAAADVALMGALSPFFDYRLLTLCGIPKITLLGSVGDWRSIADRSRHLTRFGLEWWADLLLPILGKIAETAAGSPDRTFWRDFYKLEKHSGGPYTTGWINVLFPYLFTNRLRKNFFLIKPRSAAALSHLLAPFSSTMPSGSWSRGPTTADFPSGLTRVPADWRFLDQTIPMEFLSGFVGIEQCPKSAALRPSIGWAVRPRRPRRGFMN